MVTVESQVHTSETAVRHDVVAVVVVNDQSMMNMTDDDDDKFPPGLQRPRVSHLE